MGTYVQYVNLKSIIATFALQYVSAHVPLGAAQILFHFIGQALQTGQLMTTVHKV